MIHATAMVHPGAVIGNNVSVGPYSIIGEHVSIGDGSVIGPHCVFEGHTKIGKANRFYQFCSIGSAPQDKKYAGEPTRLEIGDHNTVREFCCFSTGTTQDTGVTKLGNNNWIMAYVHIAHDCVVGDNTIFANSATLGGHVHVGDYAIFGGFSAAHQFVKVGAHSFCGAGAILLQDLPPYVMANGNPVKARGINTEGLKRRQFTSEQIADIKRAYKIIYRQQLTLAKAKEQLAPLAAGQECLQLLVQFLDVSERGIVR